MSHAERDALIGRLEAAGYTFDTFTDGMGSWFCNFGRSGELPIFMRQESAEEYAIDGVLAKVLRLAAACNGEVQP